MKKLIHLLLSALIISGVAGCGGAPVASDNSDAQRSRAEKAQSELGSDVSKQKSGY
ncbi:MAG TPA: hypothetical protein VFQ97_02095 [Gallionella sp.]|nr:hypothetical protein [Gallionella sp.]